MRRLLIMFLTFTSPPVKAQDTIDKFIIQDAIHTLRDSGIIYYFDSSITFSGKFSRFATRGKVKGFADLSKGILTFMKFTKDELKDLDRQSVSQNSTRLPDLFLPNSKQINFDSLNFLNYRTTPGLVKEKTYKWYYHFSQPIFTRNNTVAVFRLAEMLDPSAGSDLYFIYINDGKNWIKKMTVWAGAW